MFEASSDLSRHAQPGVRFHTGTRHHDTSRSPYRAPTNQSEAYDRIERDPRYRHFARIPARIVRCMEYFDVRGDRITAARILGAYYIFIAVVDNAIDSGESQTAATVFAHLDQPTASTRAGLSDVALITENLNRQLDAQVGLAFRHQLGRLYETVCQERSVHSIEAYIEVRKVVGRLTADLSFVLISPLIDGDKQSLRAFMQTVGAIGCLVDSVIDLSADRRRGLVGFRPTRRDYIKLVWAALHPGLSIGLRHPRLAGLFAHAVLDDIRDRFMGPPGPMNRGRGQTGVRK